MRILTAISTFILTISLTSTGLAQSLPSEFRISDDGLRIIRGDKPGEGFYSLDTIRSVYLQFDQPNYWSLLTNNYQSETEILATLTIEGVTYPEVGVRFRGNTSYTMIGNSPKKSFAVTTDFVDEDQRVLGYKNLKFNNAHQDATFMREVLYGQMARKFTPIAKTSYVRLFLNGEDWGIYPNIQSIDKTFLEEWFLSNDGARFRATNEETGGGGGGFGNGTAGMNYLGNDTSEYQQYYDLKSSDIDDSWTKLVTACEVLSTLNSSNVTEVNQVLDLDKILWFLAVENIFTDDDSYTNKGAQDYYVYYEPETERTFPIEYDGNSSFMTNAATNQSWNPFKNVSNVNFPLLNKLLNVPELRQRYLTHYRTILNEGFTEAIANALIDSLDASIADLVAADTKKLYTTSQYTNGIPALKTFVVNRRNFLLGQTEVAQQGPEIVDAPFYNKDGSQFVAPGPDEISWVTSTLGPEIEAGEVILHYSDGVVGTFESILMLDDGEHHDGEAGDGTYGAELPLFEEGSLVRYYVEARANSTAKTATFFPPGAEHDVFFFEVQSGITPNGVVINEILASNENDATDEVGDHEDWIELYNNNDFEVDLSGFGISDDPSDPYQWTFPAGTLIPEGGYLIVWADDEVDEGPLHANFKLSAGGETIVITDPLGNVTEELVYDEQTTDVGYARVPNGTGSFVFQQTTFGLNNQVNQSIAGVVINEIVAGNDLGEVDEAGDHEDWIELYNRNPYPVDLSGSYLTDDVEEITKWQIPGGVTIEAESYLIVWADDEAEEGNLHATFKLSQDGETVVLSGPLTEVIDSISYGQIGPDTAFARVPNGSGPFIKQAPTFGITNDPLATVYHISINEFVADNENGATDENGELGDWIELYNYGIESVDLSGWSISDKDDEPDQWQFPAGTIIEPDSYLIVWADDETEQGPLHANFKLSDEGEHIVLSDAFLNIVDSITFGVQYVDTAFARVPNGTGAFIHQLPTFGSTNDIIINVVNTGAYPEIEIHPNPFASTVKLYNLPDHDIEFYMMDVTGKVWIQKNINDGSHEIDVTNLTPGVYFIAIIGNGREIRKVVKL